MANLKQVMKKVEQYEFLKIIGKGSFATVYLGYDTVNKRNVAIKEIDKPCDNNDDGLAELFRREVEILLKVQHTNIIKLYQKFEYKQYIYLVFEYCAHGDLEKHIKKSSPPRLDEEQAKTIFFQILSALESLSKLNIVHRDLKLANILIADNFVIKLADFGFARFIQNENALLESYCGTPITMAPEILRNDNKYTAKSDIWSLGVILYQMMFTIPPFMPKLKGGNINDLLHTIQNSKLQFPNHIVVSNEAKDLLTKILVLDASKRLSLNQILQHKWFQPQIEQTAQKLQESQIFIRDKLCHEQSNEKKELENKQSNLNEIKLNQEGIIQEMASKMFTLDQFVHIINERIQNFDRPTVQRIQKFLYSLTNRKFIMVFEISVSDNRKITFELFEGRPLDHLLYDLCLEFYQEIILQNKNAQTKNFLESLKLCCEYINKPFNLISSKMILQSSVELNIPELKQQIIQVSKNSKQNIQKCGVVNQNFDVADWDLVQSMIVDREYMINAQILE